MTWQLVVAAGCRKGLAIIINGPTFAIGRNPACQLRPASPFVSERHCELHLRDGRLFVARSAAGAVTHLNDREIDEAIEIQDGDQLTIGPLSFVVSGPSKQRRPAATERLSGEEAIAEMLLSNDDAELPLHPVRTNTETLLEQPALAQQDTTMDQVAAKPGAASNSKSTPAVDTCQAASEILRQYRQRPR